MPMINGCKYACEPCIRGHRASSCAHTDRILIEVRKPGRPLESCGHSFNSCQCGKIAELLAVVPVSENQEYQMPEEDKQDNEPTQSSLSISKSPKSRSRRRSSSKVNKRSRKPAGSSSTPAPMDRGLGENGSSQPQHHPNCRNAQAALYTTQPPSYGTSSSYTNHGSYSQPSGLPYMSTQPTGAGYYVGGTQAGHIHATNCPNRAESMTIISASNGGYPGQQTATSQYPIPVSGLAWEAQPQHQE